MPILTILQNTTRRTVPFDGTPLLDDVLTQAGVLTPHPCGGRGTCGKCAVTAEGALSPLSASERRLGTRLSCQTHLLGDATVTLPDTAADAMRIETDGTVLTPRIVRPAGGLGAAIDIGTTTVALKLYDLRTGDCLGTAAAPNPQSVVAADVMGRIEAAMNGKLCALQTMIADTVRTQLAKVAPDGIIPANLIATLTGNTTMLYLLCGYDPTALSRAPFRADHLFGTDISLPFLAQPAYLPPCMNAFVGADITCAVLASGICDREETALLCDIGTNGELALWKNGTLYVTSTAAGPAFEGAGIVCGCGSVTGAIDRVWLDRADGKIHIHTIGDAAPVGICGSGVLDAVAAALDAECIDESGAMDDPLPLGGNVFLHPRDVRAVQLAKAAIAAGIDTLLAVSGTDAEEIRTLYIAGGFGSHLSMESAVRIGLLPRELSHCARILGNAALTGAAMTLIGDAPKEQLTRIAAKARHVNLGGHAMFGNYYIERMTFE